MSEAMPVAPRPTMRPILWLSLSAIWLGYLIYPVSQYMSVRHPLGQGVLASAWLAAFVASYLAAWRRPMGGSDMARYAWAALLSALSVGALIALHLLEALGGLVYGAPLLGLVRSRRGFVAGVAVETGLVLVLAWRLHLGRDLVLSEMIPFYAVAVAMRVYGEFWALAYRVHLAEEEVRRLAVANERLALARDVHDIVGHTLSVIALRADLAVARAATDARGAAEEMAQVAAQARQALHDVRAVVSRWRTVTFAEEWAHSRAALEAAGIAVEATGLGDPLPPAVDQALGYWIREGATNILRHSNARSCRLTVAVRDGVLRATLLDTGTRTAPSADGQGLQGLKERFSQLGGAVHAAATPAGFVLEAFVPLQAEASSYVG